MQWRIGEILVRKKLISWEELEEALQEQKKTNEFLGEVLVRTGKVPKMLLYRALADQFNIDFVDIERTRINPRAVEKVAQSIAQKYNIMPIELSGEVLIVGISDPLRTWPEEEIKGIAQVAGLEKVLCLPDAIKRVIASEYQPQD